MGVGLFIKRKDVNDNILFGLSPQMQMRNILQSWGN
ncbi:hypothetical protein BANRA_00039 [Klebsiella pneumoniae]|nr:hypothetical protein BANRA_00039 [Klebsiella pneumoniae]